MENAQEDSLRYTIRWRREPAILLLVLLPFALTLYFLPMLPARVPIHWNLQGEVDRYGSPETLWALPFIGLGMYFLLLFIPLLDPRKNFRKFDRPYFMIRALIQLFQSGITAIIFYATLDNGSTEWMGSAILVLVSLLFAFLGNYMTTVRPNYFVGIRTPWTLENETVWTRTHRLGGRLWFFGGLLGAVLALLLPTPWQFYAFIGILGVLVVVPVVYSYRVFRQVKRAG